MHNVKKCFLAVVLSLAAANLLPAAGAVEREVKARRTEETMRIDGRLLEAAWQGEGAGGFGRDRAGWILSLRTGNEPPAW